MCDSPVHQQTSKFGDTDKYEEALQTFTQRHHMDELISSLSILSNVWIHVIFSAVSLK